MHRVNTDFADAARPLHLPRRPDQPFAIDFPSADLPGYLVAGVPAAARMARLALEGGHASCVIATPTKWQPDAFTRAEIGRLAGALRVTFVDRSATGVPGVSLFARSAEPGARKDLAVPSLAGLDAASARLRLDAWSREILRATTKPGDGIVSRLINRPISQAISGRLLNVRGITPGHATWATAGLAVAMLIVLLLGGSQGLLPGAILFQLASIVDGVDGEIARATFRESPQGARLDSLIDAATNLAFIAGVAVNLFAHGDRTSAYAGGIGLVAFAAGLVLIARRDRRGDAGLTFNAVKDHFRKRPSRLMTALTWLTMRDFFALAFAVLIAAGLAGFALKAFLVVVCGWLLVVLRVMLRHT